MYWMCKWSLAIWKMICKRCTKKTLSACFCSASMYLWNHFVSTGSEVQGRRNTAATQHAQEGHIIASTKLDPGNFAFSIVWCIGHQEQRCKA